MAKKTTTTKKSPKKAEAKTVKMPVEKVVKTETKRVIPIEERLKVFKGDILGNQYDIDYLKKMGLYEKTVQRKMRYWCFKLRHAAVDGKVRTDIPEGLKEFVERLPGFAGWENFAKNWDIHGTNPFMIVLRLQSVWVEWDHVMERVAIPIDAPPEQINARIEALANDFARREAKRR